VASEELILSLRVLELDATPEKTDAIPHIEELQAKGVAASKWADAVSRKPSDVLPLLVSYNLNKFMLQYFVYQQQS
jgi:hypothetical protein